MALTGPASLTMTGPTDGIGDNGPSCIGNNRSGCIGNSGIGNDRFKIGEVRFNYGTSQHQLNNGIYNHYFIMISVFNRSST